MLEDLGFYCIDNIPAAMLKPFISYTVRSPEGTYRRTAVGLDARNTAAEIATVPKLIDELKRSGLECEMLFLVTHEDELLRRFAETRRKHPMSSAQMDLRASIAMERELLEPLTNAADLIIDTSAMSVHTLRDFIQHRVDRRVKGRLSVVFESFGFKHGIPGDADFVFDARSLPNPYWEPSLRPLTGQDPPVVKFLQERQDAARLIDDIVRFLDGRIPEYERDHRNYLTVAIGCTGGQHRSVYIAERLAEHFAARAGNVLVRHTHLPEKKHS